MYADRYGKTGIKPGALGVAIGLNGAILAALIFSAPDIIERIKDPGMTIVDIKIPPDPQPIPDPKPEIKPRTEHQVIAPPPPQRPETSDPVAPGKSDFIIPAGPTGMDGGVTGGTGTVLPLDPPVAKPVIVGAQPDARYKRDFQPSYPPGERRAGTEGRVTVRVLIGVDGRVKQVEMVKAASDAFFAATRKQALEKWRFKPATRDGIPQEEWRTMSVSFVMDTVDG